MKEDVTRVLIINTKCSNSLFVPCDVKQMLETTVNALFPNVDPGVAR